MSVAPMRLLDLTPPPPDTIEFRPVTAESGVTVYAPAEPPKLTHVLVDGAPTGVALEAIRWSRLQHPPFSTPHGGMVLQGWSLVPVGLPP